MHRDDGPGPKAPDEVERHAHEFFETSRELVGDRFAEARFDPDRGLRVTVIDLTDHDTAAIISLGQRLGIASWLRIERADPASLATWERLRHDLLRLQNARPRVLQQYPTPDPGYRRPPVGIYLSADAQSTAHELHRTYGEFVSLQVGALPYPPAAPWPSSAPQALARSDDRQPVDPDEISIALEAPLSVASGQTATHALLLTNLSDHDIRIHTNGNLTATIVDDRGAAVGGYVGGQHLPLVIFTASPARSVRIPVLVGTASYTSELGYAIPPGRWHMTAPIDLADGRRLVTPALELTITAYAAAEAHRPEQGP